MRTGSQFLQLFLQQANGTFQSSYEALGDMEDGVVSANISDMNNDQIPDLVMSRLNAENYEYYYLAIRSGNGDGTFSQTTEKIETATEIPCLTDIQLQDLNKDDRMDIVARAVNLDNMDPEQYHVNLLYVYLATPTGFQAPIEIRPGSAVYKFALGDINEDTYPD